jgi:hypothetical protein
MAQRINTMLACIAGCIIAALTGLLVLLKFDAPILAMLSAGLFPAIACWLTGTVGIKQVGKIAGYAAMGWLPAFMLQPAIAQSSASHVRRILTLPLLGHDWHIPASLVSTLLALIGVYFAPMRAEFTKDNRVGRNPE